MKCSRRQFLEASPMALGVALTGAAGCTAVSGAEPPEIGRSARLPTPRDGRAVLDVGAKAAFCILQITDLHFFGRSQGRETSAEDARTEADLRQYVKNEKPDLIVASGDLWHDNPEGRGQYALKHAVRVFETLEVPWAMCWGNHDRLGDYQAGHEMLEAARGSLYRGGATHGDYRIGLQGKGGGIRHHLFFMNSHQQGLGPWQLQWLGRALGEATGTGLAFFHIPVLDQATRYRPGITKGVQGEKVCHEAENGTARPVLARGGVIRACFCGHDHVNDYAVTADGVGLVYGRATGHSGYGGESVRKGAKRIDLDLGSSAWSQVTVFPDGTHWMPS